jgi:hypothetical protein
MLQREDYPLFVFGREVLKFVFKVINDEGNGGRRMGQHICDGCPTCANKENLETECRVKNEVSPSTTNLYKPEPPPFAIPFPSSQDMRIVGLVSGRSGVPNHGPTEREYNEREIIVEEMEECTR